MDRRTLLVGSFAAAITAFGNPGASAQSFAPDATVSIGGNKRPIDIALLSPNGEATAGFYASLDPFHGPAFETGWNTIYTHLLPTEAHLKSTNPALIDRVIKHLEAHGIQKSELESIAVQAKRVWDARPDLRTNTGPAPSH